MGNFKRSGAAAQEDGLAIFHQVGRRLADATFYIGETFAQRGSPREAAEQYLKISTDFATSPRAPEAMLRLGVQLKALGAKEQACATFTEIERKTVTPEQKERIISMQCVPRAETPEDLVGANDQSVPLGWRTTGLLAHGRQPGCFALFSQA